MCSGSGSPIRRIHKSFCCSVSSRSGFLKKCTQILVLLVLLVRQAQEETPVVLTDFACFRFDHSRFDHSRFDHSRFDHSRFDHSRFDCSRFDHSRFGCFRFDLGALTITNRLIIDYINAHCTTC